MIKNVNGTKYKGYRELSRKLYEPYDYEKYGLLDKIMSHQIAQSTNTALSIIKCYFEKSLIFLMKYTDFLKNFKNIHYKNR